MASLSNAEVLGWFGNNPNASINDIYQMMQTYGVSVDQLSQASGKSVANLEQQGLKGGLTGGQIADVGGPVGNLYGTPTADQKAGLAPTAGNLQKFVQDQGFNNLNDPKQMQGLLDLAQTWGVDPKTLGSAFGLSANDFGAKLQAAGVDKAQLQKLGLVAADPGIPTGPAQQDLLGGNPYLGQLYGLMMDPNLAMQADPGYQFRLQQGLQATARSNAAKGYVGSGNMATALQSYAQGEASQEYNTAVQRAMQAAGLYSNTQQAQFGESLATANYNLAAQGQGFNQGMAQQQFGLQQQQQNWQQGFSEAQMQQQRAQFGAQYGLQQQQFNLNSGNDAFSRWLQQQQLTMAQDQQHFNWNTQSAQLYEQLYNDDFMRTIAGSNALSADEQTWLAALTQLSGGNVDPARAAQLYAQIMGGGAQATGGGLGGIGNFLGSLFGGGGGLGGVVGAISSIF